MKNPTRVFDFLEIQNERFPQEAMLAAKENGEWKMLARQAAKIVK
jgi:hypothetical protein